MGIEFGPTRPELQRLADRRLREARALLVAREFDGAWYLGGYSIECALKAAIIKEGRFPPKNAGDLWVHNLEKLKGFAGLDASLSAAGLALQANWTSVATWTEQHRYVEGGKGEAEVAGFLDAIDDASNGVLTWIKQNW
jgi:hypothetical protein